MLCEHPFQQPHLNSFKTTAMNWYVTKIIYQIICGSGNHTPQFDEQVRLITAQDEAEALEKAYRIGQREQDVFCNNKKELVQWKFRQVTELLSLDEPVDGAEIYSRISEAEDADSYIRNINLKAAALKERTSENCLL